MNCSDKIINKFGDLEENKMNAVELFNIIRKEINEFPGKNLYEKIKNSKITDPMRSIFISCICLIESQKKQDNQQESDEITATIKVNWDIFIESLISAGLFLIEDDVI